MNERAIVFDAIVALTFCFQVYNYWKLGRDEVNHYTWLIVLGGYVVTETMVSLEHPVYFLYVLLNIWGIYNLIGRSDRRG